MALEIVFEDKRGIQYDESYWKLNNININIVNRTINFTFDGYKSKDASDSNKIAVDSYSYVASGDDFDALFSQFGDDLSTSLYDFAKARKDIATNEVEIKDGKQVQVKKSFFANAKDT